MTVLVVAPTQLDLKTQPAEVQRIVNTLNAKILQGNVTCPDLVDAINEYKPDILWFTSHGDWNGVMLTGCVLDADMLASAIRGTNTSLVVLNTCESRAVAERLYASTGAHVVATIGKVDDRHAFVTGQRFAVLLSTGMKPIEAFQKAKSYNFTYIPEPVTTTNGNGNGYEGLRRVVAELQMQVDRRDLIIEHLRTDMAQIVTQFQALQVRFEALQDDQEKRLSSLQNSMWLLAALMVIVLAVVLQMSMGAQ